MYARLSCFRTPHVFPSICVVVVFVSGLLSGCATLGTGGVNLISVEEEWEMGRQFEAELAEELEVSQLSTLTEMGERIVAETRMSDLSWRFYVVEDDDINAFNVPGGLVYVHSGMIDHLDDEDELAAVVAHEIGHGVARHGTQRLTQQYGLAVLAGAVLGEEPGVVREIVAQVVAAGTIARFSRAQEFEADEMGVHFMNDAGYDPNGLVRVLQGFLELRDGDPGTMAQFFATHPSPEDRIANVEEQIAGL